MKKLIIPLFILLTSLSWINKPKKDADLPNKIVYIQPLGDVNDEYLKVVKNSIENFYHFKCVIKNKVNLSDDILSKSKIRYDANKILSKFNTTENLLILTEKDIACRKDPYPEWGILGLGYRPGTTCVVSTFRMKKNVTKPIIIDRLKKVSIHEVGHNLGLNHCNYDVHCLMNDAKGTVKQVDREKIWLCQNCINFLKNK